MLAVRDLAEIPYATARGLIGYTIHEVSHVRCSCFFGAGGSQGSDKVELIQNFVTTTGQGSVVTLPNGTHLTLNSETEFRFRDQKAELSVDLVKGWAFFDAAKTPNRPLVVYVEGKEIKALGTMFEVHVDDTKRRRSAELLQRRQLVMGTVTYWTLPMLK